jgi:FkbM family methyltransferase
MNLKLYIKKFILKFLQKYLVKVLHAISQIHIKDGKKQMVIYSFDTIGHCINTWGYYEWQILDPLDLWIKKNFPEKKRTSVLDIGANIGNHTVYFADRFMKIFAYEPVLKNFKILKLNTEDLENVEIFNFGISAINEEAKINIPNENLGGSSVVDTFENISRSEKIKLKNLNEENILIEKIGLVKIDVEGMEYQTLLGISEIIKRDLPIIVYESNIYEEIQNNRSKSINFLKSKGYSNFYTFKNLKKTNPIEAIFNFLNDGKYEIVKLEKIKNKKDYSKMIIAYV